MGVNEQSEQQVQIRQTKALKCKQNTQQDKHSKALKCKQKHTHKCKHSNVNKNTHKSTQTHSNVNTQTTPKYKPQNLQIVYLHAQQFMQHNQPVELIKSIFNSCPLSSAVRLHLGLPDEQHVHRVEHEHTGEREREEQHPVRVNVPAQQRDEQEEEPAVHKERDQRVVPRRDYGPAQKEVVRTPDCAGKQRVPRVPLPDAMRRTERVSECTVWGTLVIICSHKRVHADKVLHN